MSEYSDIILAYSKQSPNNFKMENPTISHNEESRVCWDTIEVFLKISDDNSIKDFSFIWNTSIITKAAASILWESIIWEDIDKLLDYNLEYIKDLIWEVSPRRKHAATLWLLATRNAIHKYKNDDIYDDFTDVLEY